MLQGGKDGPCAGPPWIKGGRFAELRTTGFADSDRSVSYGDGMMPGLLVALLACSNSATEDSALPPPPEEPETCTGDEFCDAFMACYAFMGLDTCESYWDDGLGSCENLDDQTRTEFETCMCGCWVTTEERSCLSMGSCSDWCVSNVCSWFGD